jgi:antimicrobial peptide system SdpA family protein
MESSKPSSGQRRFVAASFILITCFWTLLFGYSIHAALPFNPVNLPLVKTLRVRIFMPQGWKFFTRNPREEQIKALSKDSEGKWQSALIGANASVANLFGLRRNSRAQGIELGLIVTSLKKNQWVECKDRLDICAEKTCNVGHVANTSPNPTFCGEAVLIKQSPVPWAWSRAKRPVIMPSKCVRVNVSCQQASQD